MQVTPRPLTLPRFGSRSVCIPGALEPRKIRNEQDGQNSVHDPENRHRDRSLQGAEEDQCNDGKLFDDGSGQDRNARNGDIGVYTVSAQTTKSSAPQCRTKNIVTPSELFAPNTNCRVVRGKKSPASPPAAVPIPEIMSIHPMDDASIYPVPFLGPNLPAPRAPRCSASSLGSGSLLKD